MDIKDYKFKVGDEVITTTGIKGRIVYICTCEECIKRGFDEPIWVEDDDEFEEHFITNADAHRNFRGFYKIGNYIFDKEFHKDVLLTNIEFYEERITDAKKRLKVIEELEAKEYGSLDN